MDWRSTVCSIVSQQQLCNYFRPGRFVVSIAIAAVNDDYTVIPKQQEQQQQKF